MKLLHWINRKVFIIAASTILLGYSTMALGNMHPFNSFGLLPLTIAPSLVLLGFIFVIIGIMKRPV